MAKIPCGSIIRRIGVTDDPGTAGCLVQFPDDPEKLFWLTAGHVLVGRTAKQFDPVEAKDLPGRTIGVLYGWTSLGGPTTTDAAIVQVDPELVLPEIGTLGAPRGTNIVPQIGARLTIFAMGQKRSGTIEKLGVDMPIKMIGPDFEQTITYVNQILCDNFSVDGCSGAIAIDENGDAVGMVVAGDGSTFTLVTPIDALLSHPDWGNGPPLEIKASIPSTAKAPFSPTPPSPQKPGTGHALMVNDVNVTDLATVLMSEASVGNDVERASVGFTVLNRLKDSSKASVDQVWNAYVHNQSPTAELITLAGQLLSGQRADITKGSTHFYSPRSMPREGQATGHFDVGGGLELVPPLTVRTFAPSWVKTMQFVEVPGVRASFFKFYKSV